MGASLWANIYQLYADEHSSGKNMFSSYYTGTSTNSQSTYYTSKSVSDIYDYSRGTTETRSTTKYQSGSGATYGSTAHGHTTELQYTVSSHVSGGYFKSTYYSRSRHGSTQRTQTSGSAEHTLFNDSTSSTSTGFTEKGTYYDVLGFSVNEAAGYDLTDYLVEAITATRDNPFQTYPSYPTYTTTASTNPKGFTFTVVYPDSSTLATTDQSDSEYTYRRADTDISYIYTSGDAAGNFISQNIVTAWVKGRGEKLVSLSLPALGNAVMTGVFSQFTAAVSGSSMTLAEEAIATPRTLSYVLQEQLLSTAYSDGVPHVFESYDHFDPPYPLTGTKSGYTYGSVRETNGTQTTLSTQSVQVLTGYSGTVSPYAAELTYYGTYMRYWTYTYIQLHPVWQDDELVGSSTNEATSYAYSIDIGTVTGTIQGGTWFTESVDGGKISQKGSTYVSTWLDTPEMYGVPRGGFAGYMPSFFYSIPYRSRNYASNTNYAALIGFGQADYHIGDDLYLTLTSTSAGSTFHTDQTLHTFYLGRSHVSAGAALIVNEGSFTVPNNGTFRFTSSNSTSALSDTKTYLMATWTSTVSTSRATNTVVGTVTQTSTVSTTKATSAVASYTYAMDEMLEETPLWTKLDYRWGNDAGHRPDEEATSFWAQVANYASEGGSLTMAMHGNVHYSLTLSDHEEKSSVASSFSDTIYHTVEIPARYGIKIETDSVFQLYLTDTGQLDMVRFSNTVDADEYV